MTNSDHQNPNKGQNVLDELKAPVGGLGTDVSRLEKSQYLSSFMDLAEKIGLLLSQVNFPGNFKLPASEPPPHLSQEMIGDLGVVSLDDYYRQALGATMRDKCLSQGGIQAKHNFPLGPENIQAVSNALEAENIRLIGAARDIKQGWSEDKPGLDEQLQELYSLLASLKESRTALDGAAEVWPYLQAETKNWPEEVKEFWSKTKQLESVAAPLIQQVREIYGGKGGDQGKSHRELTQGVVDLKTEIEACSKTDRDREQWLEKLESILSELSLLLSQAVKGTEVDTDWGELGFEMSERLTALEKEELWLNEESSYSIQVLSQSLGRVGELGKKFSGPVAELRGQAGDTIKDILDLQGVVNSRRQEMATCYFMLPKIIGRPIFLEKLFLGLALGMGRSLSRLEDLYQSLSISEVRLPDLKKLKADAEHCMARLGTSLPQSDDLKKARRQLSSMLKAVNQRQSISEIKDELDKANRTKRETDLELNRGLVEIRKMRRELEDASSELKKALHEKYNLEEQLRSAQGSLNDVKNIKPRLFDTLSKKIAHIEAVELSKWAGKISLHKESIRNLVSSRQVLRTELSAVGTKLSVLEKDYQHSNFKLKQAHNLKEVAELRNQELNSEVSVLQQERDDAVFRLAKIDEERLSLAQKLVLLETERLDTNRKVPLLEKLNDDLAKQLDELEEERARLKRQFSSVDESRRVEVSRIEILEADNLKLTGHIAMLQQDKEGLSSHLSGLERDHGGAEGRIFQLEAEKTLLVDRLSEFEVDKNVLHERTVALESEKKSLVERTIELEATKRQLEKRTAELESGKVILTDRVSELKADKIVLANNAAELEADKVALTSRISKLEADKVALENRILEVANDKKNLLDVTLRLKKEKAELLDQIIALEENRNSLEAKVKDFDNQLQSRIAPTIKTLAAALWRNEAMLKRARTATTRLMAQAKVEGEVREANLRLSGAARELDMADLAHSERLHLEALIKQKDRELTQTKENIAKLKLAQEQQRKEWEAVAVDNYDKLSSIQEEQRKERETVALQRQSLEDDISSFKERIEELNLEAEDSKKRYTSHLVEVKNTEEDLKKFIAQLQTERHRYVRQLKPLVSYFFEQAYQYFPEDDKVGRELAQSLKADCLRLIDETKLLPASEEDSEILDAKLALEGETLQAGLSEIQPVVSFLARSYVVGVAQLAQVRHESTLLSQELQGLRERIDASEEAQILKAEMEEVGTQTKLITQERDELRKTLEEQTTNLNALKHELSQADQDLAENDGRLEAAWAALSYLGARVGDSLSSMQERLDNQARQVDSLSLELKWRETQIKEMEDRQDKLALVYWALIANAAKGTELTAIDLELLSLPTVEILTSKASPTVIATVPISQDNLDDIPLLDFSVYDDLDQEEKAKLVSSL